jgi:ABC-type glucose/galactose transport system permease subunit
MPSGETVLLVLYISANSKGNSPDLQLVAIPLFLVQPTLFLSIFYFLVGLQQSAVRFLTAVAVVLLLVQDVIGLGMSLSKNKDVSPDGKVSWQSFFC